ncbi:helix-turn-helix domain-containing protein [Geomesophilobacter sediminis]|nr:helix-turn-helix transcriptional regulator [Geomesophilobacter sediminis]
MKGRTVEVRFAGEPAKIRELKLYAKKLGLRDTTETVPLEQVMPEMLANNGGICIRGGRTKEGLTQVELSKLTGIPQRHLSEMENGKRSIGRETAKKLAEALNVDYRVFL